MWYTGCRYIKHWVFGLSFGAGEINIFNVSTTAHSIVTGNETTNAQTLNIASKNINLGNSTVVSNVTTKAPLTIGYTVKPSLIYQIGGSLANSVSLISLGNGSTVSLPRFLSVPAGIYQLFYNIRYTISTAPIEFTSSQTVVSNTENNLSAIYNDMNTLENATITRTTGSNVWRVCGANFLVLTASSNIYFSVRHDWTVSTGTLIAGSNLRIVRIG
jgi:hypothetical protein